MATQYCLIKKVVRTKAPCHSTYMHTGWWCRQATAVDNYSILLPRHLGEAKEPDTPRGGMPIPGRKRPLPVNSACSSQEDFKMAKKSTVTKHCRPCSIHVQSSAWQFVNDSLSAHVRTVTPFVRYDAVVSRRAHLSGGSIRVGC